MLRIHNVHVANATELLRDCRVTVADGRIAAVEHGSTPSTSSPATCGSAGASAPGDTLIDGQGGFLLPGFIDLHIHGALGSDFLDADAETIRRIARYLAAHGVTGFLVTTSAAPREALDRCLARSAEAMRAAPGDGARCLGVHLEGPYINDALRGMHPRHACRAVDRAEYRPWLESGTLRRMTASLELPGGDTLLTDCVAAGVLMSLGHSACTSADVRRWAGLGLRHVTHLYNAMSRAEKQGPVRVAGCLEGALTEPRVLAEVIADGWHVPEPLFRVARLCKGRDGITVCSDGTPSTGAAQEGVPTPYGGGQGDLLVVRGGVAMNLKGTTLVGSVQTLGEMAPRLLEWCDGDWPSVAAALSTNSAGLIGLGDRLGRIAPGCDADLVLTDAQGHVRQVWVAGVAQMAGTEI